MASIHQCLATLRNIESHSLLPYGRVSVVSGKDNRLNFNSRLQEQASKLLQYWSNHRHPGLLPPCPINHPRRGFSHQDPHFVFRHRTLERRGIIITCPQ